MAITVTFYKDFEKKYNSTKQPLETAGHADKLCNLKDNTSVLTPVLEVAFTGLEPTDPMTEGYNYCYISSFERYYFVTDWKYYRGLWYASCSVDVLASYKTKIGALSKYVNRSASSYDLDLADSVYPMEADASLSFVRGDNPYRQTHGCFVVGLIGNGQSGAPCIGGINYYTFTYAQMKEFIDYLLSDTFAAIVKDDAEGFSENLVKAFVNPLDYIESCIWIPFEIQLNTSGTKIQPQVGWWTNLNIIKNGYPSDSTKWGLTPMYTGNTFDDMSLLISTNITWTKTLTIPDHSQVSRGRWLNSEPYSSYVFHMDPFGDINLPGPIMMNHMTITLDLKVEGVTGMGVLEITSGSSLIARRTAPLGVSISIAQVITDFASAMSVDGAVGGVAGAISSGKLKAAWNVLKSGDWSNTEAAKATGQRMQDAIEGVGSDVISGALAYNTDISSTGVAGSPASYILFTTIADSGGNNMYTNGAYIRVVRFNLVGENLVDLGRPLCQVKVLNTLSGFIKCSDGEHDVPALESEKSQISGYLTGGFFYE